jgi:hypothetical protein
MGFLKLSLRGGNASDRRGNPSCLRESGRGWRFAYWLTVDRHGLRPRDDKGGENGILGCEFTPGLPPCLGQDSPRSPALLAFLETNTEAYVAAAVTGGAAVALS